MGGVAGVYTTPAIHVETTGVFTNTTPTGPYRGAGRPEATYAIERVIDVAARELGIDPLELRRRNLIPPVAMPFKTGLVFTYDCGDFARIMDAGAGPRRSRRLRAAAGGGAGAAASSWAWASPTPSRSRAASVPRIFPRVRGGGAVFKFGVCVGIAAVSGVMAVAGCGGWTRATRQRP